MLEILIFWWILVSLVAVVVTAWDKLAAKRQGRRTPEATLLWLGFIGGAEAMYLTMTLIRHKTRKPKFMLGLPLMIVLHIAAVFAWLWIKGDVIV